MYSPIISNKYAANNSQVMTANYTANSSFSNLIDHETIEGLILSEIPF